MKKLLFLAFCLLFLNGCAQMMAEREAGKKVIIASEEEVAGCTFLGDVDSAHSVVNEGARFWLKVAAAKLGATHVVETHGYAVAVGNDLGIAHSGRAYRCPLGTGPLSDNKEAQIETELPVYNPLEDGFWTWPSRIP